MAETPRKSIPGVEPLQLFLGSNKTGVCIANGGLEHGTGAGLNAACPHKHGQSRRQKPEWFKVASAMWQWLSSSLAQEAFVQSVQAFSFGRCPDREIHQSSDHPLLDFTTSFPLPVL